MTGHRLLVVDDHPVLAESLEVVLSGVAAYDEVATAVSAARARELMATRSFDRAVVDVRLPDGDGTDLVPEFVAQPEGCRVVVLTASPHPHVVTRALAGGASSVLAKGVGLAVLLDALDGLDAPPAAAPDGPTDALTPREVEVLQLLAAGHDVRRAARTLGISHYTVRDHLKNTFAKLGVVSQLEAVVEAHRVGLIELDRATS